MEGDDHRTLRRAPSRRQVLHGGLAVGLVALTGCASDPGQAQLVAARPLLRSHAQLLADVYGMQSVNGRALTLDDTPDAVAALAATVRRQVRTDERIDTLASVAPAPDLTVPRPDPDAAVDPDAPPDIATVDALVEPDELPRSGLARGGLTRSLTIVRTQRDTLDATAIHNNDGRTIQAPFIVAHGLAELAAHRIALDTETITDAQLPWWMPRLREKYRQANAITAWQLTQGDTELTRTGRYRIDIAGTWTIEDTTQTTGERHVQIDWQPSRSGSRSSVLTIRQGSVDATGLATWNERFTTTIAYDHDQLWGP